MKKFLALVFIIFHFEVFATINNYTNIFIPVCSDNKLLVAIRSYELNEKLHFLLVDPYNLKTYQKASDDVKYRCHSYSEIKNAPYYQALEKFKSTNASIKDFGLKRANHKVNGMFLTVDMCPSQKKFEKEFFEYLSGLGKFPIAIAVSGFWILEHQFEFKWLVENKHLDITWVNHSFSHPYHRDIEDLESNFLNIPRTNIEQEILLTEKMLLDNGLIPSIFFRFPGLIASKESIKLVNDFGLIPLSTDAWLGRGEIPTNGSIILVHGNSNEPRGIKMFMELPKDINYLPLNEIIRYNSVIDIN